MDSIEFKKNLYSNFVIFVTFLSQWSKYMYYKYLVSEMKGAQPVFEL